MLYTCRRPVACSVLWHGSVDGEAIIAKTLSLLTGDGHEGWICDGDHAKWGWRALAKGSTLMFRFATRDSGGTRQRLTLDYMKSYGAEWGIVQLDVKTAARALKTAAKPQEPQEQ